MTSILGHVTEELGEIGKKVVTETAKIPGDVAGKALESLGGSSSKKIQGSQTAGKPTEKTPLDAFGEAKGEKAKREIARAALEYIAGVRPKPKEPSVWERIQAEVEQKNQQQAQQQAQSAKQQLPNTGRRRPRGDLYGIKAKRASAEMSRNVRQD